MDLRSEFSDVKSAISKNRTEDIDRELEYEGHQVKISIENGYLIINIPDTNGNPHSPQIQSVQKRAIEVFGMDMLPDPETGSVRGSIGIEDLDVH